MTAGELQKQEEEFDTCPLSALTQSVKNNTQVLINCGNIMKLLCCVKAFHRHCNMVLENVKGMWTEVPKNGKGKKKSKPVNKGRYISKMFLRGRWSSWSCGTAHRWQVGASSLPARLTPSSCKDLTFDMTTIKVLWGFFP
ncbi:small nuclear ribonucleoprotein Sm D2-like [Pteronotus mesoamericanus]|uniref:small nuclear ribonucleoprotein Sm D2-like n=1 Tax=Pteronotus mesoamericanus TaxID=1884717 RepID=UPI0023EB6987|nr:small nuclear ribonucleoprotein Sm D2-like [Pteronotus parnellii mesoamericanus]